jgi:drug/metabolite transporter (DMT)-like permease
MPEPQPKNNRIMQFILITIVIIIIGIFLGWWNTGDIYTGLHAYASSIILVIVGVAFLFIRTRSDIFEKIGIAIMVSGIILMLSGIRL